MEKINFVVEPHFQLPGHFWIGDDSGQFVCVRAQEGFEDDDRERCEQIAQALNMYYAKP